MRNNQILDIFSEGFEPSHYRRINKDHILNLYIGKNAEGRYAFEYRGNFTPKFLKGVDLISVSQEHIGEENVIRFALGNDELIERFSIFCLDLLESVQNVEDVDMGYNTICDRYTSWKKLFKPTSGNLSELEIMGLIGELLFLKDEIIPFLGERKAIESWMGPEKLHKDFSFNDIWVEVKTINVGKDAIRISSIEQLDSNNYGTLAIYRLERMSSNYEGIKLNALVYELLHSFTNAYNKDIFMSKLSLYGYDGSTEYDNYVYSIIEMSSYIVDDNFPRLKKDSLPIAILKAQYELSSAEIETYKRIKPWM